MSAQTAAPIATWSVWVQPASWVRTWSPPTIAWITTDSVPETPFGAVFRVIERFPLDVKTLKKELAARGIGTLEIKKRGVDVDPAAFRARLALKGRGSATLILTRIAGARVALLAERV